MLKNFVITPPIIGRISIGRVVERNGKRLPEKDDQFTITTQVKNHDGWILHPEHQKQLEMVGTSKLRSIGVTLPFNDPDLCLRAEFVQFDRKTGRPLSTSDGVTCRQYTETGVETVNCSDTTDCCMKFQDTKPFGRLYVKLGDSDDLDTFIFRTTSYNSIRTLAARLAYYAAVSGDNLSTMALELKLRAKSTAQSFGTPIYYVDLVVREGLTLSEAITQAKHKAAELKASGFDQKALDAAARVGFANAGFEDMADEIPDVLEEFYPEEPNQANGSITKPISISTSNKPSKVSQIGSAGAAVQKTDSLAEKLEAIGGAKT